GVHHRFELQFQPGADSSRAKDGTLYADHRRDGARNRGWQGWKSRGGFLHRQGYSHGTARKGARICGGRERLRIGETVIEFEIYFVSGWAGKLLRSHWPIPDRLGREFRHGVLPST